MTKKDLIFAEASADRFRETAAQGNAVMKVQGINQQFTVIGENVHCTRVLRRQGPRVGQTPTGTPAVLWTDVDGTSRYLCIAEQTTKTSDFREGRVKHIQIAVRTAMAGGQDADSGLDYLNHAVQRQVQAGVDFLDLNVDEISFKHEDQKEAMKWLVRTVQSMTNAPLSVDSSLLETIEAGMAVCDARSGRPLLNSASLERRDALDLAVDYNAQVIITSAGASGMPADTDERVNNASRMIDLALKNGIRLEDMYIDPLVFPISVDSQFGLHYLNAVRQIRRKYGPQIHITGGMSNVSFGIPARQLINDVFVNLAIEYGADGSIIDPVARNIQAIVAMDRKTRSYQLAHDVLVGTDRNCKNFLRAYRNGELKYA